MIISDIYSPPLDTKFMLAQHESKFSKGEYLLLKKKGEHFFLNAIINIFRRNLISNNMDYYFWNE